MRIREQGHGQALLSVGVNNMSKLSMEEERICGTDKPKENPFKVKSPHERILEKHPALKSYNPNRNNPHE